MVTIDFLSEEDVLHQLHRAIGKFRAIKNSNDFSLRMNKETFEDIGKGFHVEFIEKEDFDISKGRLGTYDSYKVAIDDTLGYGIVIFDD